MGDGLKMAQERPGFRSPAMVHGTTFPEGTKTPSGDPGREAHGKPQLSAIRQRRLAAAAAAASRWTPLKAFRCSWGPCAPLGALVASLALGAFGNLGERL